MASTHSHQQFAAYEKACAEEVHGSRQLPAFWWVEVKTIGRHGDVVAHHARVPATIENARLFGAFGRGTLLQTTSGPIAIEDLTPGTPVITVNGREEKVLLVGRMRYSDVAGIKSQPLVRVMQDAFGLGRPEGPITIGPYTRFLRDPTAAEQTRALPSEFTLVSGFADGQTIVEVVPPNEVQLFHLCLREHTAVCAGGLWIESFPPPTDLEMHLQSGHRMDCPHPKSPTVRDYRRRTDTGRP